MTDQAAAAAKEPQKMVVALVGNVAVHGMNLISKKLADVIVLVTTSFEPECGISTISFNTNNKPLNKDNEPVFGILYPDTGTVMFNLLHHFNSSYDEASTNPECRLSMRAIIWHTMLITLFHEIHHAKAVVAAAGAEIVWDDEKDTEATKWALTQVNRIAKFHSALVEPPSIDEEPFFGPMLRDIRKIMDGSEEWQKRQMKMLDDGSIYIDGDTTLMSMKEYLRLASDDKDSPEWTPTTTIIEKKEAPVVADASVVAASAGVTAPVEVAAAVELPVYNPLDFNPDAVIDDVEFAAAMDPELTGGCEDTLFFPGMGGGMAAPNMMMPGPGATMPAGATPGAGASWVNPVTAFMAGGAQPVTVAPGAGRTFAHEAPQQIAPHGLSVEEQKLIMKTVNMRLFTHIFTKCGFNPMAPSSFENAGAVYEPVPIGDIPNVNKLIVAMDTTNPDGSAAKKVPVTTFLKGVVFSKTGLPGYWMWLNINGWLLKRTFVPQNPNKTNANGATAMAQAVRRGEAIAWMIADGATGQTLMKAKVACAPGGPITYTEDPFKK